MNRLTQSVIKILPIFGVFLLGILVSAGACYGWQKYQAQKIFTNDEVVMEVLSTMIVIPEELPTIVTVTDREKLADQPFFAKAENGDKVILYTQNRRAYLFRPSERKIIDMTVVAVQTPGSGGIPVFQTNDQ